MNIYTDTRQGVIAFLNDQEESVRRYILNFLNISKRNISRWSTSKSPARREFCVVAGLCVLAKSPALRAQIHALTHRQLIHFVLIWRFENQVQDQQSLSRLFGISGQAAQTWLIRAQRDMAEAYRLAAACIGYNSSTAVLGIKNHKLGKIQKNKV